MTFYWTDPFSSAVAQAGLDKLRPRVRRRAMAFAQVVIDRAPDLTSLRFQLGPEPRLRNFALVAIVSYLL